MPSVILFPGQGAQYVGMCKQVSQMPKVKRMFEFASHVLKTDLLALCANGPKFELDKTINCQAAVFVASLAAVEQLKLTNPTAVAECYATAGFSVGEYAALVMSGALTFEDAMRVIAVRSQGMQRASEALPSGLMSVFVDRTSNLKLAMLAARRWCREQLKMVEPVDCQVANYLSAQCKVIGGNAEALDFIEANQKEFNIRRVKRLEVSGAFHTSIMESARPSLKQALADVHIGRPIVKFYANFDGDLTMSPEKIRGKLVSQVSFPVRWEQILNTLLLDENLPFELAASSSTSGAASSSAARGGVDKAALQQPQQLVPSAAEAFVTGAPVEGGPLTSHESSHTLKKKQSADRVYPDVYECGPTAHSGSILRLINGRASQFYKHIKV